MRNLCPTNDRAQTRESDSEDLSIVYQERVW